MAKKRDFKRVLVCGDFHCGSICGLTPPKWQEFYQHGANSKHHKFVDIRRELFSVFAQWVERLRPIDILFLMGDLVDGRALKSGGVDILESDLKEQADMAAWIIDYINAPSIVAVYGTDYHVAVDGTDIEDFILGTKEKPGLIERPSIIKVGAHEWPEVNGTIFDLKHKVGRSSIPHGKSTPLSKVNLWNSLWAERNEQPKAHVFIRAHVHYHAGAFGPGWIAMTCPALQGMGSRYGSRECEGTVDFGLLHFDCFEGGDYQWQAHRAEADSQKAQTLKL